MNKTEVVNTMSRKFNRISFQMKKHSPEILVVAGVVGTVVSAVMACRATTKIGDILEEPKENIEKVHRCVDKFNDPDNEFEECYTPEDAKKDLTIIYVQTGVKLAKLYGPAVLLGTVSIASILTSNNILKKRNVALAAAYATIDKGFKEYKNRVVARFGEEVERELRYNIKAKNFEDVIDDDGKEIKVESIVNVSELDTYSEYARFFDEASTHWEKDPEYNLMFLRAQQQYANDKLKATGMLFLNEVYDMLDIPRTKAGQIVGWVYDSKNPIGDNYVDFGIYDTSREKVRDFVNGYERVILLDFNVDGNVLDLM